MLQNLDIAAGRSRGALTLLRRRSGVPDEVAATLETIGLTDLVDVPAGILPHGQKQWLEIGMLLVQDAKLLMLDEPVAGMSAEEKDETGRLLQRIAEERTVVIVEHDMDFMRAFAKSVTVLHAGKVLSEGSVAAVQADPRVQEVYLGPGHHAEDEVAAVLGRRARNAADARRRGRLRAHLGDPRRHGGGAPGRGRRGDGAQRGGQDDAAAGGGRAAAGAVGADPARRRGRHRAAPRTSGCGAGWPTSRRASSRSGR